MINQRAFFSLFDCCLAAHRLSLSSRLLFIQLLLLRLHSPPAPCLIFPQRNYDCYSILCSIRAQSMQTQGRNGTIRTHIVSTTAWFRARKSRKKKSCAERFGTSKVMWEFMCASEDCIWSSYKTLVSIWMQSWVLDEKKDIGRTGQICLKVF